MGYPQPPPIAKDAARSRACRTVCPRGLAGLLRDRRPTLAPDGMPMRSTLCFTACASPFVWLGILKGPTSFVVDQKVKCSAQHPNSPPIYAGGRAASHDILQRHGDLPGTSRAAGRRGLSQAGHGPLATREPIRLGPARGALPGDRVGTVAASAAPARTAARRPWRPRHVPRPRGGCADGTEAVPCPSAAPCVERRQDPVGPVLDPVLAALEAEVGDGLLPFGDGTGHPVGNP